MTTVVMLTALDLEYQAIRRHLDDVRMLVHPAGTVFEVGVLPGRSGRVALAVTGEGNLGAAVVAERAVAMFRPDALFCVGVAGGLKPEIALGDVVVATQVYAVGGGREHDDGFAVRPRAWGASHELEQAARHVARRGAWCTPLSPLPGRASPTVHFKPIACGEVVHQATTTEYARRLRDAYDDAVAVEMESAGVAQAARLNRALPALTVRAISDHADRAKALCDAAGWQPVAAGRAAAFATATVAVLLGTLDSGPPTYAGALDAGVERRIRGVVPVDPRCHRRVAAIEPCDQCAGEVEPVGARIGYKSDEWFHRPPRSEPPASQDAQCN